MSVSQVAHMFECFGLATQKQRDKILSQGSISIFELSPEISIKTWASNSTDGEHEEGGAHAKLESAPR